jgi:hypothetical protein
MPTRCDREGTALRPGERDGGKLVFIPHVNAGGVSVSNNHGKQESSASKNVATQENQAWAQWEYAPAEWALLDRMDWGRVALRHWLAVRITGSGSLLAFALFLSCLLQQMGEQLAAWRFSS